MNTLEAKLKYVNVNAIDILNKAFGNSITVDKRDVWYTKHGVKFIKGAFGNYIYFLYDNDLPFFNRTYDKSDGEKREEKGEITDNLDGVLNELDIPDVVELLKKRPNILREKSTNILTLEKNFPLIVFARVRHRIGGWIGYNNDKSIAFFNNPFNTINGFTDSEDNFEINIYHERLRCKYATLNQLYGTLFKYRLDKINKVCDNCKKITHRHCNRCEVIYFCSKECQTKSWPTHKSFCNLKRLQFKDKKFDQLE